MSCARLVHVVKLLTHLQILGCDLQENARPDPLRSDGAPLDHLAVIREREGVKGRTGLGIRRWEGEGRETRDFSICPGTPSS